MGNNGPDWTAIRLVVFDLDGTLYCQRSIRKAMLAQLLMGCLRHRSPRLLRVIYQFRALREELGQMELDNFHTVLIERTARKCGLGPEEVAAIAEEWLERKPLPLLRTARYPHVERVFEALRARGIGIGVLSDYPVDAKLVALGLNADLTGWAGDPHINALKPNPRGLRWMIERADVAAGQTLMIGDRDERDGEIARRCGVEAWIRTGKAIAGVNTFSAYDQPPFASLLA